MASIAQIVVDLDPELRDALFERAKAEDRPESEIVEQLIANYVVENDDPDYWAFVAKHVEAARQSLRDGRGIPNAEVEAKFAARREAIRRKHG